MAPAPLSHMIVEANYYRYQFHHFDELSLAQMIYTSAYYPQGNGINESVHRELDKSISIALEFDSVTIEGAAEVAVQLHNSVLQRGRITLRAMFVAYVSEGRHV